MVTITIELTDVQYKALSCVAYDPEEYLQNYANARTQKAIDGIAQQEVQRRLDAGEPIPQSKDEIVMSDSVVPLKDQPQEEI